MSITLDAIAVPDGLRWEDEHAWSPVVQATEHTVTGALVVEEATRLAGRPITLVGGRNWAWMSRADLQALHAALTVEGAQFTLTLHDGRQFTVIPRQDGSGPLEAKALPIVADSGPADPTDESRYVIERLRLMEI